MAQAGYAMGYVRLYEGNGGQQKMIKEYAVTSGTNIGENVSPNDEARSLKLVNIPKGMYICVYDSKNQQKNDDFTEMWTDDLITEHTVSSFENSYEDKGKLRVVYTRKNGLDGKVSSITIRPA